MNHTQDCPAYLALNGRWVYSSLPYCMCKQIKRALIADMNYERSILRYVWQCLSGTHRPSNNVNMKILHTPDFVKERILYKAWQNCPDNRKKRKARLGDELLSLMVANNEKVRLNNGGAEIPEPWAF